jgi:hypothetical protein
MKYKLQLILISLMILSAIYTTSCESTLVLDVENQTDQTLLMRVDGNTYFMVLSHSTAKGGTTLTNPQHWLVEGINNNNEILFSKYYDYKGLKNTTLKVLIPSKESQPYLPITIENLTVDKVGIYVNDSFVGWIKSGGNMIKNLFPPDFTSIKVVVYAEPESIVNETKHIGPDKNILNKIFYRNELEESHWKLTITSP